MAVTASISYNHEAGVEKISKYKKSYIPMYSNSSLRAIPLWDWHCLQIKANRLAGPSPTKYSTMRSMYPRSRGITGLGNGGPGAAKNNNSEL